MGRDDDDWLEGQLDRQAERMGMEDADGGFWLYGGEMSGGGAFY